MNVQWHGENYDTNKIGLKNFRLKQNNNATNIIVQIFKYI